MVNLRPALLLFIAILTEARKQKSWLGPNRFLSRISANSYSGLLTESNGKVYGFGSLFGSGGKALSTAYIELSIEFPLLFLVSTII